jgi:oxalate decarboxylase
MRLATGGWARQTTIREFPVSTDMAGVDMRLNPGAIRELHWHVEGEWGYIINGSCQITCLDSSGRNFVDNLTVGDMWFFPSSAPHSIQAFEQGVEFLLVFTNGVFSENDTFLLSDTFDHLPKEVLAKNFGVPQSAFANLPPASERWIYGGKVPPVNARVYDPYGTAPAFSYHLSQNKPILAPGGQVNVVDARVFPETDVSAAIVLVNPGHMRAIHWHVNNEWQYYIEGTARMTAFAASGTARTFDYQAGDAGYVPSNFVHYIENTGKTPLRFLEIFSVSHYIDFELAQWMGVTPRWLVQDDLNVSQAFMDKLPKKKLYIV